MKYQIPESRKIEIISLYIRSYVEKLDKRFGDTDPNMIFFKEPKSIIWGGFYYKKNDKTLRIHKRFVYPLALMFNTNPSVIKSAYKKVFHKLMDLEIERIIIF